MALEHKISISMVSKSIMKLYDNTGKYDSLVNLTGFGSGTGDPNPDLAEVADVGATKGIVLFLEDGAGNSWSWDVLLEIQNIGFPNDNNGFSALEASKFGLTTFPSGKLSLTSRISGEFTYNDGLGDITEGFVSQATAVLYNTKTEECCVEKLALRITPQDRKSFCDDPLVKLFNQADILLSRIKAAASRGAYTIADTMLAELQQLCEREVGDCGC